MHARVPRICLAAVLAFLVLPASAAPKKVALIAGPITGHGKEAHEYEKSVVLLRQLLEGSPSLRGQIRAEVHPNGWPADPRTLDDADTIFIASDGGDHRETDHPLYVGDRYAQLKRQMQRGCGIVFYHWSVFHPVRADADITEWAGGYFDYETGPGPQHWRSAIQTWTADAVPVAGHPVTRGVAPWSAPEEFYYRIRFRDNDPRLKPVLLTRPPKEGGDQVVAWSVERADGGRGFGTTGGHFYAQWWNPSWRRMMLNAIAWTAHVEVPPGGVESEEFGRFKALVVTGANHPAHDWNAVSGALVQVLEHDPRALVHVLEDPDRLGEAKPAPGGFTGRLADYDLVVWNYVNWERPGLAAAARQALMGHLARGGGLALVHFGASAFHPSLPGTKDADVWPEFTAKIARRVWEHRPPLPSGHDPFGPFHVDVTGAKHPVTAGLAGFDTRDELYFHQAGTEPIEPLATAWSKITRAHEPMAWAYAYGKARVFQTVLGHGPASIHAAGALIRRGCTWAAGREPLAVDPPTTAPESYVWRDGATWRPSARPAAARGTAAAAAPDPLPAVADVWVEGKEGRGLDARVRGVLRDGVPGLRRAPLTVQAWVRLGTKDNFNIIAASEAKASPTHWELYTYAGSGTLSFYSPGLSPAEVRSSRDVCDGRWHHVAAQYGPDRVRLWVDGEQAADVATTRATEPDGSAAPFAVGRLVEGGLGCSGWIDSVVVEEGIRAPRRDGIPESALVALRFESRDEFTDGSRLGPVGGTRPSAGRVETPRAAGVPAVSGVDPGKQGEKDWTDNRWQQTEVGPFLASVLALPDGAVGKGLSVRLGGRDGRVAVAYDTASLAWRAGWTGGLLRFDPGRFGLIGTPRPAGDPVVLVPAGDGWPGQPRRYVGLRRNGWRTTLEYDVAGTRVLEEPGAAEVAGRTVFTRSLLFGPSQQAIRFVAAGHKPGRTNSHAEIRSVAGATTALLADDGRTVVVALVGAALSAERGPDGRLVATLPAGPGERRLEVRVWSGPATDAPNPGELVGLGGGVPRVPTADAGPACFPEELRTAGKVGADGDFLAVDTLAMPYENPWHALLFAAGVDFTADGTGYVCTIHGDVWRITGVDAGLKDLRWRRFATGLSQPLGLKVRDGQVFVLGRDRITRLVDSNGDGEADFQESFFDGIETSTGGHDYVTDLEKDDAGNFYYVDPKGVHRVRPDGKSMETLATGFRNPNGMGVRPDGKVITVSPQQGTWTPSSQIAEIRTRGYYGFGGPKATPERPLGYDEPLCWIPHGVDNSSGGQAWIPEGRWGVLGGQMMHLLWGRCGMMLALRDEVAGGAQGAVVPLPAKFLSGPNRATFREADGALYVAGSTGWQTSAARDGAVQRVRFTGRPVPVPVGWHARPDGIELKFGVPLDRKTAEDPGSWAVKRWNYRYAADYGSKDWSVAEPSREGRDEVAVTSARLSADGRTVLLGMADAKPAMQYEAKYNVDAAGGKTLRGQFWFTIRGGGPAR
ncbi:MAG: hypothetical protein DVB31_01510 [Verrucomicrobia bacterium]|nr:MAG: hypothetical protein DVB31_01510 [Verrucomicrobiota bacterium]